MKQRHDFFQWPQVKNSLFGISHPCEPSSVVRWRIRDHDIVQPVQLGV